MIKQNNSFRYQFTYKNFAAVLNKYQYNINPGDIVAGTIFSIEKKGILVDIGASIAAFLPLEELNSQKIDYLASLDWLNETREFFVLAYDEISRQIVLSVKKADHMKAWQRIKQIYLENIVLDARVLKFNKGGTIVEVDGLKGFVPISHMISREKQATDIIIPIKILEIDQKLNYLLCSFRCAYIQRNPHIFFLGQIIEGTVYSIKPYGILLSIDKVQGLLHISEIVKQKTQIIEDIFFIGQRVQTMIIHIDTNKGRITLSQKTLLNEDKSITK